MFPVVSSSFGAFQPRFGGKIRVTDLTQNNLALFKQAASDQKIAVVCIDEKHNNTWTIYTAQDAQNYQALKNLRAAISTPPTSTDDPEEIALKQEQLQKTALQLIQQLLSVPLQTYSAQTLLTALKKGLFDWTTGQVAPQPWLSGKIVIPVSDNQEPDRLDVIINSWIAFNRSTPKALAHKTATS